MTKLLHEKQVAVPILNYTRCGRIDMSEENTVYPYCWNYLDQTNCTVAQRIGGRCSVNGFMSNISNYVICDSIYKKTGDPINLCDDGLENACFSPFGSKGCTVHKHKMCDGVNDCANKIDESHYNCRSLTKRFRCERSFYSKGWLNLPTSWILDDATDCLNGDDENITIWSLCGTNETRRVKLHDETCEDVFRCVEGFRTSTYVSFHNLCDGVESCGMENRVCWISRDFPTINSTAISDGSVLDLCKSQQLSEGKSCTVITFRNNFSSGVFGVANSHRIINVPDSKVNCSNTFGEYYVYLSCMDLCSEPSATCPMNTKTLLHDSCPDKYPDRVYTPVNNSYLTFVRQLSNGHYDHPNPFQCNNSRCILDFKQVCNLIDDCGDASDEINCINHFICENTVNESRKHLISIEQRCDGRYDCFDFSDECNDECGREILGSAPLKYFCWVTGIFATVLNTITIFRGVSTLKNCETESLLITRTLVSIIGCGDLFVGIYLVALSVFDSVIFGREFCKHQAEWLTGFSCSVLGVISTLGSQLSIFAMSALSIVRVRGIVQNTMKTPSPVGKRSGLKAIVPVIVIVTISSAIVFIPLVPALEDYFVQGMYYDPNYKVFIGFPDKARHLKILEAYFSNSVDMNNVSKTIAPNMTWQDIGKLVDEMFTKDYGTMTRAPVHFYGNDGVCLFKYFVRSDDARRSRQTLNNVTDITDQKGDSIVWLMMGINLFCVILIVACYAVINVAVRKSSRDLAEVAGGGNIGAAKRHSEELSKRITVIIASDFLSWVPFIVVSALHNLKHIDATNWYVPFAMIVLPINSAVNPMIYDVELTKSVFDFIISKTRIGSTIRRRWQRRGIRKVENAEIEPAR